jgi:hypothetical protein
MTMKYTALYWSLPSNQSTPSLHTTLPATDIVPVWLEGNSHADSKPDRLMTRAECRAMKKAGTGYFSTNGTRFILCRAAIQEPDNEKLIQEQPKVRDESCRISGQDRRDYLSTMTRFVIGDRKAQAAVNAWRPLSV